MILLEMINILFLFLAVLEFCAVILSLPAKIVGDLSSFCYGASRAIDAHTDNNDPDEEENE